MIKFFRKIRQKLLSENKISKYLIYGIGEIILVVIGILIALWINSTYQHFNDIKDENRLLSEVKSEFEKNKEGLSKTINRYTEKIDALNELNSYISPKFTDIKDDTLDRYIFELGDTPNFQLSHVAINTILESRNISIIRNEHLRTLFRVHNQNIDIYYEWIARNEKQVYDVIIPYMQSKYPVKRVLTMIDSINLGATGFKIKKRDLLTDITFESIVSNRILDARAVVNQARRLQNYYSDTLAAIDKQLKD